MRNLTVLAVLLASVSITAFAQTPAQNQVPSSVENYTPPPMEQLVTNAAQVLPSQPAYQYTPYKIDTLYRSLPFAVVAQAVSSEVKKEERGLLWTYTNFKVLQAVKGNFENNAFTLKVVGGAQEAPLLKEYLNTGGLDLGFAPGQPYFLFIDGVNEAGYPIVARQHIYAITGEPGKEVISDFKGGTLKIKKADGIAYTSGEPVLVSDFLAALAKVKK